MRTVKGLIAQLRYNIGRRKGISQSEMAECAEKLECIEDLNRQLFELRRDFASKQEAYWKNYGEIRAAPTTDPKDSDLQILDLAALRMKELADAKKDAGELAQLRLAIEDKKIQETTALYRQRLAEARAQYEAEQSPYTLEYLAKSVEGLLKEREEIINSYEGMLLIGMQMLAGARQAAGE